MVLRCKTEKQIQALQHLRQDNDILKTHPNFTNENTMALKKTKPFQKKKTILKTRQQFKGHIREHNKKENVSERN